MNSEDVTIISIVGKQNAGKTTLIRDLIPKLKEHEYTVGTLKYNIRKFDVDHEGKDTYKYFHSGADSIALTSHDTLAVVKKVSSPPKLNEIIETHLNDVSVVLVEGYREDDYPRIRLIDSQEAETVNSNSDNELLLVKENPEIGRFSAKDINKALDFIETISKNI
ncbi:MAG: molybdopterin-guanine dinucleotide biosynthesis protein B [Candidatus Scalindua sp.]|jgi:molybdopterin-guanine dinucleotide biosynthesis protein B|nr:molybdopterin-guanine dinucleotide biosynthesis protein B [Candidatus Scalindua sp.]MBT5307410.1 molybdopterin-guanine dinucleotide biosynthesis protein B [Candidatus Scalindua sp.]MBT6046319.1 molybdopterin-guanine dinucleotide biosynthesis protein B [Candidatus Scalindua sp.]MBT6229330.1 molybdopterin-guanine dinucleotide biosynthesis protein B [Candidatus Scalindua sp.]MBT6564147.1 molybdopterin-guanine dinucleotide biosynthesis protein B [Candidatus Scalindua sp.]